jgi:hypothetical protein
MLESPGGGMELHQRHRVAARDRANQRVSTVTAWCAAAGALASALFGVVLGQASASAATASHQVAAAAAGKHAVPAHSRSRARALVGPTRPPTSAPAQNTPAALPPPPAPVPTPTSGS